MLLYLLRHAEATPYRVDDFSRRLTEKGIVQAERVGEFLAAHSIKPELILTSPVTRARETAKRVAQKLGGADLTEVPWLACGMSPEAAMEELAAYTKFNSLMIVGHEPDFSTLISILLRMKNNGSLAISKASLTAIDLTRLTPGSGVLRFFLPVKLLLLNS